MSNRTPNSFQGFLKHHAFLFSLMLLSARDSGEAVFRFSAEQAMFSFSLNYILYNMIQILFGSSIFCFLFKSFCNLSSNVAYQLPDYRQGLLVGLLLEEEGVELLREDVGPLVEDGGPILIEHGAGPLVKVRRVSPELYALGVIKSPKLTGV